MWNDINIWVKIFMSIFSIQWLFKSIIEISFSIINSLRSHCLRSWTKIMLFSLFLQTFCRKIIFFVTSSFFSYVDKKNLSILSASETTQRIALANFFMQNDRITCYLVAMQIVLEEAEYGGPNLTTNFGLVGQKYDLHSN